MLNYINCLCGVCTECLFCITMQNSCVSMTYLAMYLFGVSARACTFCTTDNNLLGWHSSVWWIFLSGNKIILSDSNMIGCHTVKHMGCAIEILTFWYPRFCKITMPYIAAQKSYLFTIHWSWFVRYTGKSWYKPHLFRMSKQHHMLKPVTIAFAIKIFNCCLSNKTPQWLSRRWDNSQLVT